MIWVGGNSLARALRPVLAGQRPATLVLTLHLQGFADVTHVSSKNSTSDRWRLFLQPLDSSSVQECPSPRAVFGSCRWSFSVYQVVLFVCTDEFHIDHAQFASHSHSQPVLVPLDVCRLAPLSCKHLTACFDQSAPRSPPE